MSSEIVLKEQVALGPLRCLGLALSSLRHRWSRCSITVSILALAVAFLVHGASFGLLTARTRQSAARELAEGRRAGELSTRLGRADTPAEVERQLGRADSERLAEYARWAGPGVAVGAASASAQALARAGDFLRALPAAPRSVLLGERSPEQLWAALTEPAELTRFQQQLASFHLQLPGLSPGELQRLIAVERPRLREVSAAVSHAQERALAALQGRFPGRAPAELALDPPPGFAQALSEAGFAFSAGDVQALGELSRSLAARTQLRRLLLDPALRNELGQELDLRASEVTLEGLQRRVLGESELAWLAQRLGARDPALAVPREQLSSWLRRWEREDRLLAVAGDERGALAPSGWLGLPARTWWLVVLSFLVCLVGVANALFMSVTERFSEIATLKCLGALDSVVLLAFVFEAVLQGFVGGLLGVVFGAGLALARGALAFGPLLALDSAALAELLSCSVGCLLAGTFLSALAALGPAWVAARLLPMEAMRVD